MIARLTMLALFAAAPMAAQPAPDQTARAPLSLQQSTALKCSAAFALGAGMQARGQGAEWPALGEPGALAAAMPPCLLLLDASGL